MDKSRKQHAQWKKSVKEAIHDWFRLYEMSRTGKSKEREKADWWLLRAWVEGEREMGVNGVIFWGDEAEGEQQYTRCHEIIHFKMDIIILYGPHINKLLPPKKPHSSSYSSPSNWQLAAGAWGTSLQMIVMLGGGEGAVEQSPL